ncbi:unnamed protein product [Symbiodinium sp. CCMP2456]|nr:unnamed protein product [Symbiodinium sp. CCMP2456]
MAADCRDTSDSIPGQSGTASQRDFTVEQLAAAFGSTSMPFTDSVAVHHCRPCVLLHTQRGCGRGADCPYCHVHLERHDPGTQPHRPRKSLRSRVKREIQELLERFDMSPSRVHDEWQGIVESCPYARNFLSGLLERADAARYRGTRGRQQRAAIPKGGVPQRVEDATSSDRSTTAQIESVLSGQVPIQNGMVFRL